MPGTQRLRSDPVNSCGFPILVVRPTMCVAGAASHEEDMNGKGWIRPEAFYATCLSNRDTPHRAVPIERLEPCDGKLSRTVLRGLERATASGLPGMDTRASVKIRRSIWLASVLVLMLIAG